MEKKKTSTCTNTIKLVLSYDIHIHFFSIECFPVISYLLALSVIKTTFIQMTYLYLVFISLLVQGKHFLKVDYSALKDDILDLISKELQLNPTSKLGNVSISQFNPGHPLDIYWLFKHWTGSDMKNTVFDDVREYLPTREDLKNVAVSIVRLQEIYKLSEESIAKGVIHGERSVFKLESEDFQFIGKAALDNMNFESFHVWYSLAVKMASNKETEEKIRKEYGNLKLKETFFTDLLNTSGPDILKLLDIELSSIPMSTMAALKSNDETSAAAQMFSAYRELCRQPGPEFDKSWKNPSAKCIYEARMSPLQPFKMEIFHDAPLVMVIHDLTTPNMAKSLSRLSKPYMEAPRSISSTTGKVQKTSGRVGKVTFLNSKLETQEKIVQKMRAISGQVTGLDSSMAEMLQVVSYGMGGHYEPHVDYFGTLNYSKLDEIYSEFGDRMATLLFYLNDVQSGGSTVFPYLGISIPPVAGSALFWHNLDHAGVGYRQTMHAGCPVLLGHKEVANLWFWVMGQHHTRPCQRMA